MKLKDLSRDELMKMAQETYDKDQWSPDDVYALRACWDEFDRRGGDNAIMFFRPAYWGVLKFHEVDSGEVDERRVEMYERTGAEIAADYREVIRKLHGVDVSPYEKPEDLPKWDGWEALEQLMRITSQEAQNDTPDC